MAKNYSNKNRKRKALIAMLCALSVTCTGLAAACAPAEEDEPSTAVTAKEDSQLLKNGDFEHFDIPDKAIHLIKNVNSWTLGGSTSVKSGIIGTSDDDWGKLTDSALADKLDLNNDLSTDNEDYVNYNSMRSRDIPYKDAYAATFDGANAETNFKWVTDYKDKDGNTGYEAYFGIEGNSEDGYTYNGEKVYKETLTDDKGVDYVEFYYEKDNTPVRKTVIDNPGTHWGDFKANDDGTYAFGEKTAYKDENGNYYLDEDLESDPVGNVLMIHNAPTDATNNGIQQYYSSTTITLEAHSSAEISLWVKTSDLRFNKGYVADENEYDKGAYIEVVQTVASTTLDSFQIKAINTEKILAGTTDATLKENNGWVQYTVYVNACDFADTTIQLRLGLGGSTPNETVTGYAFFDDVQVTKYRNLEAEGCSYDDGKINGTSCTLTSEEDDKIFYADVQTKNNDNRHAYDFYYLIDLASEAGVGNNGSYSPISFDNSVKVGLTTEKDSKGVEYSAAESLDATVSGVSVKEQTGLVIPKDLTSARPTDEDLITVFESGYKFDSSYKYANLLNNLTGENAAPELLDSNGNTLVMYSNWGAPYTATITNNAFTLEKDGYLLVSFWVKTSDMNGKTAATVKIYELDKDGDIDENSVQTLTVDTTGNTTDFEDEEDIYNGWVQCFFFVKNDTDDKDEGGNYIDKTFQIDFSFGETSVMSATSYGHGYAAIANLQTLKINEDIYNLASAGSTTALFTFAKESAKDGGTVFDEATGTSDVTEGIALPDTYTGANGANVLGSLTDKTNAPVAGLINRDSISDYSNKEFILGSFMSGATSWDEVFGNNCYQPLIIINNLREYALKANANEENFTDYYIKNDDGSYTKVSDIEDAKFEDYDAYYSLTQVANYGFVGADSTVSASSSDVISVRVKVSGDAVAYIYLVDTDDTDKLLNFTTPSYTFWYDEEGNVLSEELDEDWTTAQHREHIVYTLRDDGLYDGKDNDGKVYGNLYNLVKSYKDSKYEHTAFYDAEGNPVSYDDLKDGETYYKTEDGADGQVADHYLCSTDGTNVYECIDGKYYYVEITKTDDKTTEVTNKSFEVTNFDNKYARYSNPEIDEKLFVTVTADDCDPANGLADENGWVTVNFVISTGSEAKNYRLELWSGARDGLGVEGYKDGAVAFDYFHGTVSDGRLGDYEKEIENAYNRALIEVNNELNAALGEDDEKVNLFEGLASGTNVNIRSYEELIGNLTEEQRDKVIAKMTEYGYVDADGNLTYKASYYTYTLYDSEAYVPFNANTAGDGETGYNYDPSLFNETLAYFRFDDNAHHEKNVFVDYNTVDQTITKNTVSDDDETEEEETTNTTELGLYISSIVLVVVLLITLVSILVTQYIKKRRKASGAKNSDKNVYRKRDRYVKKLHLVKDEVVDAPEEEVTPVENEVTEIPEEATEPASEEANEPAEENEPAEGEDKE